ncbi:MAG TPA: hypothetical protein VKA21_06510 [Candidatus Binatia bacterium]|nr:hypothetical protein [Candidatus Binatia bacterium]
MPSTIPRWWGAVADAVGHCVLIFAFAPTLAALPGWLYLEAHNPLNLDEPLVLMFAPMRGVIALLDAFAAGVLPGVLAGAIDGILVVTWFSWGGDVSTRRRQVFMGAIWGALAAGLMLPVATSVTFLRGASVTLPAATVAFEITSGIVCGMVATPTAIRLLAGSDAVGSRSDRL